MKIRFTPFLLLLLSNSVFSQPINHIKGSFRFSKTMDKIYFLPTENQNFTLQETYLSDNWLKKILSGTKYNYNNLTIDLDFIGNVRQTVKGCFYNWFKKLDINSRFNLMEHLKPNGIFFYTSEEVNLISDALNNYTIDNVNSCQYDTILGDLSTIYITIALEQYLSDKSNNRPYNKKYNAIFEKSFNQQYRDQGYFELKKFQTWLEFSQSNVPDVSTENIDEFTNRNDHSKWLSFIRSSELLSNKCFDHGSFIPEKCSFDNIGNHFVIIQLKRKTKILNNLIWTGQ